MYLKESLKMVILKGKTKELSSVIEALTLKALNQLPFNINNNKNSNVVRKSLLNVHQKFYK